jgi:NAD(P)-dependent dehydrogenase (short-subunit alcohol dehydrogenase family)
MAAQLWSVRLAADNIQVIEIRPGVMATDMTSGVKRKYDRLLAAGLVPQERWGTGNDVGLAVGAFILGRLPFSTGSVIHVDGGVHIRRL